MLMLINTIMNFKQLSVWQNIGIFNPLPIDNEVSKSSEMSSFEMRQSWSTSRLI